MHLRALTGGVISLGLFLSQSNLKQIDRQKAMSASRSLYHAFKSRFGSTCCRILIKKVSSETTRHFEACCDRGGWAAEQAARLILAERPELICQADQPFVRRKDSRFAIGFKKILSGFFPASPI